MLLRRVTEHVKAQNWTAVSLDFVIVVIGVFVGLQVSSWNDERVERHQERGYLIRLHEDILASANGIDADNTFLKLQLSDQERILTALDACDVDEDDQRAIQRGINSLGFLNAPNFFRRTYDELSASGRMDIIHSDKIKAELAGIVADVEFREKVAESVFRLVEHHRFIIEEQVRYDLSRPVEGSEYEVAVDYDLQQLCKQPKNAAAISAISFYTRDRLNAFSELHHRYSSFLPVLENELLSRWGYDVGGIQSQ